MIMWVAVKELRASYHTSGTTLLTKYPYDGNSDEVP